jgi:DnaK suppressor protein
MTAKTSTKKRPVKKPTAKTKSKKTESKKAAPARKKAPAQKKAAAAKKTPVKKTATRKATGSKKKVVRRKVATAEKAPAKKSTGKAQDAAPKTRKAPAKKLNKRQRERFRNALLSLRDRLTEQIFSLKNGSLTREDTTNLQEDGSDAFDRQVALNLVTSEHKAVFQIDEALRALTEGTYGVCEGCSCLIEIPRLEALPFVRMCVKCQAAQERGTGGGRPFGARRRRAT